MTVVSGVLMVRFSVTMLSHPLTVGSVRTYVPLVVKVSLFQLYSLHSVAAKLVLYVGKTVTVNGSETALQPVRVFMLRTM